MADRAGWDRRDPWTLRFADPELERSYQRADQAEGLRRIRTTSLVAAGVWVLVALIAPSALGVPPGPVWLISGIMTVFLLASAGLSHWATTHRRRDAIGMAQQLAAGIAVLLLTVVTDTFAVYAMPGIMLTAVFGFSVTRYPFVGSVGLGAAYCLLFLAFALRLELGSQLPLQVFLVAATVVGGCLGAYLLEQSQRAAFTQSRLVSALHERVDQLLHQYLSPDVASALIEDPGLAALGGEVVDVTVLFADLSGFTPYSERTNPAAVVALLNSYFDAAVPAIFEEGGTIVQFAGDAVMAIWNAPLRQPDHALRAARAGLRLQAAVGAIASDRPDQPRFRVGLNTGPALVGNVGGQAMRSFTAIGDAINLAARLQTFAEPGQVVLGQLTYEQIRDVAVVRALGTPQLKGKAEPVHAYELVELRSSAIAGDER